MTATIARAPRCTLRSRAASVRWPVSRRDHLHARAAHEPGGLYALKDPLSSSRDTCSTSSRNGAPYSTCSPGSSPSVRALPYEDRPADQEQIAPPASKTIYLHRTFPCWRRSSHRRCRPGSTSPTSRTAARGQRVALLMARIYTGNQDVIPFAIPITADPGSDGNRTCPPGSSAGGEGRVHMRQPGSISQPVREGARIATGAQDIRDVIATRAR